MVCSGKSVSSMFLTVVLGFGGMAAIGIEGQAQTIPSTTAIPVSFTITLDAGKVKLGETVTAKTTQVILLPGGQSIPKGSALTGHVVDARPFAFNSSPYATQRTSTLAVHFDKIAIGGTSVSVNFSLRAIAGPVAAHEASIPHYRDDTDSTGTRRLIGGIEFSPLQTAVLSADGNAVEYNRKQGLFARLMAVNDVDGNSTASCGETSTEQSVGIFSPAACGVYELDSASISDNGTKGDGTFVLESSRETVKLFAKSEALLQVE